jgi:Zn-dependent M16 (insulinase) family peptidase
VAVHGSARKFAKTEMKLELLFNKMENENSRFLEPRGGQVPLTKDFDAFTTPIYSKSFFKTPLSINNCSESLQSLDYNHDEYGTLLVASQLISNEFLLKSIREKGGAYGAGCRANESGIFSFYSYRDPKIEQTFDSFEQGLAAVCEGDFSQAMVDQAKLLTFQ